MSSRGIFAWIIRNPHVDNAPKEPCMLIGFKVPQIHLPGNLPLYVVTENAFGSGRLLLDGKQSRIVTLVACEVNDKPKHHKEGFWIQAIHEELPWSGLVPVFEGTP